MRLKKILSIGLAAIVGVGAITVGGGLLWRASLQAEAQNARLVIDKRTGVDEMFKVKIGGIEQWFHARGAHRSDPVLLWLHGGPGTPMMAFEGMFQKPLENHFIVVQWDQRGAGKTYVENPHFDYKGRMSYDLMLSDAVATLDMLKARYGKAKIVVLGHSWGSMLGIGLVQARPNDIAAYVGTGQVVDITQNESLGYQATLAEAERLKDTEAIRSLLGIAPYPESDGATGDAKTTVLRKWENAFGFGISRRYRVDIQNVMLSNALRSPEYSLSDVHYFVLDEDGRWPLLSRDIDKFRASKWGATFNVPVILLLGRHDWQTPSVLAAQWFGTINAPYKQVVWFENSAHSAMVDEPDKFARTLIEIVEPIAKTPTAAPRVASH